MRALFIGFCLALVANTSIGAELEELNTKYINTRFGEIRVINEGSNMFGPDFLLFENEIITGVSDTFLSIDAVFRYSEEMDVVLISVNSGGTACPTMFALVGVSKHGARHLGTFGTCSDIIMDYRRDGSRLEFDVPSLRPELSHVTAVFDGTRVAEIEVRKSDYGAAPAGPGEDVTRWVGEHPASPFNRASERLRFKQIMSDAELFELMEFVRIASPAKRDGGYVIGKGIAPHSGGQLAGAWAIRISDGRPLAVIWRKDEPSRIFGGKFSDLPTQLRDFAVTGN